MYEDRPRPKLDCSKDVPRTQQHFKDECNINTLVRNWITKGAPPPPENLAAYGNFADAPDYFNAQLQMKQAQDTFDSLPAHIRKHFDNEPGELLRFALNPDNLAAAVELGLVKAPDPEPPPAPPEPPQGEPDPPEPPPGE